MSEPRVDPGRGRNREQYDLLLQHRIMQAQIGCGPQGLCLERECEDVSSTKQILLTFLHGEVYRNYKVLKNGANTF